MSLSKGLSGRRRRAWRMDTRIRLGSTGEAGKIHTSLQMFQQKVRSMVAGKGAGNALLRAFDIFQGVQMVLLWTTEKRLRKFTFYVCSCI